MKLQYINHMGSDLMVVNLARLSFDVEHEELTEADHSLIRYLATGMTANDRSAMLTNIKAAPDDATLIAVLNKYKNTPIHFSPFAHPQVSFSLETTIALARQLWKSHVGAVGGDVGFAAWNEMSRRYVSSNPDVELAWHMRLASDNVKQGSSDTRIPTPAAAKTTVAECISTYNNLIHTYGVAPECARDVLPMCATTRWVWTGSLAFWARLFNLRSHPHAQLDQRNLMIELDTAMCRLFPLSWDALTADWSK